MAEGRKLTSTGEILPPTTDELLCADNVTLESKIRAGNTIVAAEGPITQSYADALAFMEEVVTVTIRPSTDKNAEQRIMAGCNGEQVVFQRGVPLKVKRKFLESLLGVEMRVETPQVYVGGEKTHTIQRNFAPKYDVSVIDPNPKGHAWLEHRMLGAV